MQFQSHFDVCVCGDAVQQTYSVEEAVEAIGFGRFHIMLFFIMGSASVSVVGF